jgi:hypothetical protein
MLPTPEPPIDPPYTADEKTMLCAFLDLQRGVLRRKVGGLSPAQLLEPGTPSTISLLGLLKHSAYVERYWFRAMFAGEDVTFPWTDEDPDADWRVEPDETPEQILALYLGEVERSRAITAAASLDDLAADDGDGRRHVTMRWILIHMIEEVARHLGHADLIRERLDGATGD